MQKLDRELGLLPVFSLSVGAMLGVGIFAVPGLAVLIGGPAAFLAYLAAGLLVIPAALSKAEMATAMPVSGGTYVYLDRSLGPLAGTLTGLGSWLTLVLKSAFGLVALSAYLAYLLPISLQTTIFIDVLLALLLILINCFGAEFSGRLQAYLVLLTLVILLLFVGRGSLSIHREYFSPLLSEGWLGYFTAVAVVFVSYAGVTKIVSVAEEIEEPARNIPWGIILSLVTMIVVYTLVAYVIVGNVPGSTFHGGKNSLISISIAGEIMLGRIGGVIMGIVAVVALISMTNAGLLSSSRFPLAMARDQHLPDFFAQINPEFGTPVRTIVLTGSLLILFLLFLPVRQLAELASAFQLLVFFMVNVALIILRESEIEWYQPEFTSPLYPFLQLFGAGGTLGLLLVMGIHAIVPLLGALLLLLGSWAWYHIYVKDRVDREGAFFRGKADKEEIELFRSARSRSGSEKESVIVPFFQQKESDFIKVERRIRLAAALCKPHHRLDIVRFAEVPEQSFLSSYEPNAEISEGISERVQLLKKEFDVEFHQDEVMTHNAREALRSYAREEKPYWIVFDWQQPSNWQFLVGESKWWLDDFPCNQIYFKNKPKFGGEVLVFARPGPNDLAVVSAADRLSAAFDGGVTFLDTPKPGCEPSPDYVSDYQRELMKISQSETRTELVSWQKMAEDVIEQTRSHDLLVLDASTTGSGSFFSESVGEKIAREAHCGVLEVRTSVKRSRSILETGIDAGGLDRCIAPKAVKYGLKPADKEELFREIAELFGDGDREKQEQIEMALWERENLQDTYIEENIVFPHAVIDDFESTHLAIIILDSPVEYTESGKQAKICVATVGPSSDRETHLQIISLLSEEFVESSLREFLLRSRDPEAVAREINSRVEGSGV